ncbi:MAG TPA: transketolase [Candidatus Eremiobacteraceae bacterium]|nr:transketolase [Candidatus Eremiobacteraceae bacterium]
MKSQTAVAPSAALDQLCINTVRTLAMDAVQKANSGHPGTAMALAPAAYVLWTKHLRYNPKNPRWINRDRFVLSAGHACILQYSMLFLTGYDLSLDDLKQFRQWGSKTPGHPEFGHTPGIEITTGPLGQGVGNAVGFAIAEARLAAQYDTGGADVIEHFTYAICSDGDLMEGVASEAASLAGHLRLGKLICLYDDNHITIEGNTSLAFDNEDVCKRFDAYGWHTQAVEDANDLDAIDAAFTAAKKDPRPSLIRMRSHIAWGSPHKQDTAEAHGSPLGADEIKLTKRFYGWPEDAQFLVPDEVLAHMRLAVDRGAALERDWQSRFDAFTSANPDRSASLQRDLDCALPPKWADSMPTFAPADGALATRIASKTCIQAIAAAVPFFAGGSADLAPSTETLIKDGGDVEPGSIGARNFHFGIREHGMGAVLNGMTIHGGIRPFGATFLIFSDYMRPAVRLACLMGINPIYVWTHDSIGLGEDGPTHQSIEQLASLRAIPNMTIMRPADANETAICWRLAIEHRGGPVGFALTRQKLPVLEPNAVRDAVKGGYVLARESGSGPPKCVLIGTGSEVQWCIAARDILEKQGCSTRVVSLPCWEYFDKQPQAYRDSVIPPAVKARVAVEAASPLGWERYIGEHGAMIGMTRFGASAPGDVLFKQFGFTAEHVAEQALALLRHTRSD